jgi:flagellum-specific peptidoglycan hydrolase FlgJ
MKSVTPQDFKYLILLTGLMLCLISARPVTLSEKYIDEYKELAISEMERTGIPASIKMAQALLESQSGKSELALNANNHFGIKCKNNWTGEIYYYHDDDTNHHGEIIASCFRSYDSPVDSYKDHSNFLLNRPRYSELFSYSKTDYVAWAQGLKKCGYATDPNYSERLIKIIQKFNLNNLDLKTEYAESSNAIAVNEMPEVRIEQPVSPIIPKQVSICIAKNVPKNFIAVKHKSKQKNKRKKRF